MKKAYQKPVMEFENFRLDVEIASRNPAYDAARQAYEIYCRGTGDEPTQDGFAEFLRNNGWDANDGWCYFTAYVPS